MLENLTAENTAVVVGPHTFAILGTGDRTVIMNCDVLSDGADVVSLWLGESGRYYHAGCRFKGSVVSSARVAGATSPTAPFTK